MELDTHNSAVIKYYQSTRWDYENLWTGNRDLAVHFGYYNSTTRNHRNAVILMNSVLAGHANIRNSDHVLDAGCGYGGSTIWLAENIGCSVAGITIVPFQVEVGTKNIKQRGLADKAELFVDDFSKTKFSDESFDVYWALESIVHAENRQDVLNEAFRVLKKSGRIVIATYTYRESPKLSDDELQYIKPWLDGWAMPQLLVPSEYVQRLKASGFSGIEHHDITSSIKPSIKRLKTMCLFVLQGARILRFLKIFNRERVANVEGSLRQARALDHGLWRYSIFTAKKP